jgi:checkpoint serine/threonine-protein kinase
MKVPSIQLIDFGSAVDMDWYDKDEKFTYVVTTENFTCCEMLEGKPWTYQSDLFGIAGTVHVMLFGRYMEVVKNLLTWNIKTRLPRYFNKPLWEQFFNTLLNIPNCDMMPNLQQLKDQFEEEIHYKEKYVCDKIAEFNHAIGSNQK